MRVYVREKGNTPTDTFSNLRVKLSQRKEKVKIRMESRHCNRLGCSGQQHMVNKTT